MSETTIVSSLTKFVDALPIPPKLEPVKKDNTYTYYEVTMKETKQSLHRDLPSTTVWGYEGIFPGPTIEVDCGEKVFIKWMNALPKRHLLPVDFTVHGAHKDVPEVRTVVHVHGAVVEPDSDGYPDSWFSANFEQVGPTFTQKIYRYDNYMNSCTLWYHDHALGITRLNIYAGLAGMYIVRSDFERSLKLPSSAYDFPLIIQDRSFRPDGSLYYPTQPDEPVSGLKTSVVPEFFGNTILVNGKVWPYLVVEPRKYRFRVVNASNSRFYRIKLDSGQLMYQIGTDRGLMDRPIGIRSITLAPAERADLIIDFTNLEGESIIMTNDAPAPFPKGDKGNEIVEVMKFFVELPLRHIDTSVIPAYMENLSRLRTHDATKKRFLTLDHTMDRFGREMMLLDNKDWDAPISEKPVLGSTEIWYLVNTTEDTHPIHIHLVDFQILGRREYDVERFNRERVIEYRGDPFPPEPQECGRKDTVRANPGEVTKIIMKFGPFTGLYVWHCHMLEHEDYEMMRPYMVIK
ncbi:multicopper oxidase family protein [Sutcliffiella sp. NPDC057660]|uniref:multicopper oxidase family protein n=1 Tax=Sutcliffiella sp. NPDC057660 TaxID=3346199 RepID=UPI0036743BB1